MLSSLSYHPRLASAYDAGLICLIPIFWLRLTCLGTTPVSRYSIHQPLSFLSFSPSSLVVVTQRHCLLLKVTDDLLKNCSSSTRCLMFWSTDHIISFLLAFINLLKYCLHLYPPSRETALSLRKVLLFIIVSVAPRMEPCRCSENLGSFEYISYQNVKKHTAIQIVFSFSYVHKQPNWESKSQHFENT